MITEIFDSVFDPGIYTSIDYEFAKKRFAKGYNIVGGCSAAANVTRSGAMLVGRNMDLNISSKPAYVVRTDAKGFYPTLGLAYTFTPDAPDCANVRDHGLSEEFRRVLPFLCTDVLNNQGLYIEINMRSAECWPTGDPKFLCSGTNPQSADRVYVQLLARYIGDRCANVSEAVEYVRSLDLFTKNDAHAWNFCYMMADASGHYGLLEIAQNRVIWHDFQRVQTNFYIDPALAEIQELKCGMGRFQLLSQRIESVESEAEMFALMDDVSYFQIYSPEKCRFDLRSEFCGTHPHWTYDYVMSEAHRVEVQSDIEATGARNRCLSRAEMQRKNALWESVFTEVINCSAKTLSVRFFEDASRALTLSFDVPL